MEPHAALSASRAPIATCNFGGPALREGGEVKRCLCKHRGHARCGSYVGKGSSARALVGRWRFGQLRACVTCEAMGQAALERGMMRSSCEGLMRESEGLGALHEGDQVAGDIPAIPGILLHHLPTPG